MLAAPTSAVLVLAATLFALGALGFLIRRNLLILFISLQLMFHSANLVILAAARDRGWDAEGQALALFVIAAAAAEAALGLAFVMALQRLRGALSADEAQDLEG